MASPSAPSRTPPPLPAFHSLRRFAPPSLRHLTLAALAFTASGLMLLWGARREQRDVAVCGALWLCLHALFHVWIWWQRGLPFDVVLATNVFGIQLPAWGALWAARRLPSGG